MTEEQPRYTAEEWAKFQEMQRAHDREGGSETEPEEPDPESDDQPLLIYWSNLVSIRFWIACGLVALLPTMLAAWLLPDAVAGILFWVFLGLAVLLGLLIGDALDCPKCGKNVKMGKSRCHHCGYDIPSHT